RGNVPARPAPPTCAPSDKPCSSWWTGPGRDGDPCRRLFSVLRQCCRSSLLRAAETVEDAQAKMAKVEHAQGPPQERPTPLGDSLRPTIARSRDEVIGDLVQPVRQRLAEPCQRLRPTRQGLLHPGAQPAGTAGRVLDGPILEDPAQPLALFQQLLQPRETLL